MKLNIIVTVFVVCFLGCAAQKKSADPQSFIPATSTRILAGAERINVYLPLIKGKRIGIFANQTSMVGNSHLVDTLQKLGVDIRVIFGPEHGFRGNASAGEHVGNESALARS